MQKLFIYIYIYIPSHIHFLIGKKYISNRVYQKDLNKQLTYKTNLQNINKYKV
jgi:hypothetical protein